MPKKTLPGDSIESYSKHFPVDKLAEVPRYISSAISELEGNILVKGEITDIAEQALTEAEVALQHIESDENILQGQRNFQNTIKAIEAVLDKLDLTFNPFEGLKYTGIHFDFVFLF